MRRSMHIPLGAGSEPECIEIDDAHEAIGEIVCNKSPNGRHYWEDCGQGDRLCKYCGCR